MGSSSVEREFEAHVRIQMAVRHVMHYLPDGPAVRTVRRVELRVRQAFHRCAKFCGRLSDFVQEFALLFIRQRLGIAELTDGITEIAVISFSSRGFA